VPLMRGRPGKVHACPAPAEPWTVAASRNTCCLFMCSLTPPAQHSAKHDLERHCAGRRRGRGPAQALSRRQAAAQGEPAVCLSRTGCCAGCAALTPRCRGAQALKKAQQFHVRKLLRRIKALSGGGAPRAAPPACSLAGLPLAAGCSVRAVCRRRGPRLRTCGGQAAAAGRGDQARRPRRAHAAGPGTLRARALRRCTRRGPGRRRTRRRRRRRRRARGARRQRG